MVNAKILRSKDEKHQDLKKNIKGVGELQKEGGGNVININKCQQRCCFINSHLNEP